MNDITRKAIKHKAGLIRAELAGGLFMGEPIDMSDEDMVLVASNYNLVMERERDSYHTLKEAESKQGIFLTPVGSHESDPFASQD